MEDDWIPRGGATVPPTSPATGLLDLTTVRALLGVTDAGYERLHEALMGAADPETEGLTRSVYLATASELTVGVDAAVEVRTHALALLGTIYDHFKAFAEFEDHGAGEHEFVDAESLAIGFQAIVQHGTADETVEMLFKALDYDSRGTIEEFELDAYTKSSELFRNALRAGADQLPFKKVSDHARMLVEKMLAGCDSLDDRSVNKAELRAYLQKSPGAGAPLPPSHPPPRDSDSDSGSCSFDHDAPLSHYDAAVADRPASLASEYDFLDHHERRMLRGVKKRQARNELRAVRRRAYVATLTRVSAGQIASGVAAKAALFAENVACESRQYVVGHIHAAAAERKARWDMQHIALPGLVAREADDAHEALRLQEVIAELNGTLEELGVVPDDDEHKETSNRRRRVKGKLRRALARQSKITDAAAAAAVAAAAAM